MLDLSHVNEQMSEEQEAAVTEALEQACLLSITTYLNEVADTMEANAIETLNVPTLRAMATELQTRTEQ